MLSRTRALEMLSTARVQKQPLQKQREKEANVRFSNIFFMKPVFHFMCGQGFLSHFPSLFESDH